MGEKGEGRMIREEEETGGSLSLLSARVTALTINGNTMQQHSTRTTGAEDVQRLEQVRESF